MGYGQKIPSGFTSSAHYPEPEISQRSTYDSAMSGSRLMDFGTVRDIGTNQALQAELSTIRARSRHEMKNNGSAKGMGRTYANGVVGKSGARLKINSPNKEWNKLVEAEFAEYAKTCEFRRGKSLGQLVHLGVKQFFPCGEYFIVPRIDHAADTPVKLRFLMIRPDRIITPNNTGFSDGIETDVDGRALRYWILKQDPDNLGQNNFFTNYDFESIPAKQMIHVFMEDDPIQLRGEPWLAQALVIFHKLRRLDADILSATATASKFAAFMTLTIPEFAENAEELLPSIMDLEPGTLTALPAGYDIKQVKPEHPSTNISDFRRDQLATAGRAACMPVNAVTGDSSKHNFASARFDGLMMTTDADLVRAEIETHQLDRMFNMWLAEATRANLIPIPIFKFTISWLWLKSELHTDPLKSANAESTRLKNGTITVGEAVLESGRDDVLHLEKLLNEVEYFRENNIVHPLDAAAGVTQDVEPDEVDEEDKEEDDEQKEETETENKVA